LRLRTIGGLWIEGEQPRSPLGPRPLALLALVAAAGEKGISRERVVGIFWADTDEEQARHTLSQTLYRLKRDTGRDWFTPTVELRLDPGVSSDIGDLHAALAAGELETVATLYTGKFLDGFYLPGAPEFDRWVEEERDRLHHQAVYALERLAARTDAARHFPIAVRLWHRLTQLDPLSARYAMGYMRALAAGDDRPRALAHANLHRETVRRELETEPDPALRQLESALRAPVPARQAVPPASLPVPAPAPVHSESPAAEPRGPHPEPADPPRRRHTLRWLAPMAVGLVVLGFAARGFRNDSGSPLPFLAVGDIRTEAADSSRLGAILRDMLATSLGSVEGLQVVANSRLVELMPRGVDPGPQATNDAARRAGATQVIEGELTAGPAGMVLSLRRVALPNGIVRKGYVIRAADRYAMVDSATAAIARDLSLTPPSVPVTEIRTSSPVAYALYEEGLRANYGYDGSAAYRLMKAALQRDSGFAMAAYYVWRLSRDYADASTTEAAMARAKQLATSTIDRERLQIQGAIAEVDAPLHQALAIAETLTVKYPSDPEGHLLLGSIEERAGDWAAAGRAYARAVALDSAAGALRTPYCRVCTALFGMTRQYLWWDSAAAAERSARRLIALRPDEAPVWANLIEPLLRQERRGEAVAAWDKSHPEGPAATRDPTYYRDDIRWGRFEEVDRVLRQDAESGREELRREAWWLLHLSLRDQGRLREVDSVRRLWVAANLAKGENPADQPSDVLMSGMERGHPEVSIRYLRRRAERTAGSTGPPGVRNRYLVWYLTLAGTVYAASGDTAVVRRLADSVEALGPTSQFGRDAKLHYFLRGLLFQRQGRHGDAVDAFQRSLFSLTDGYTRINLMMARSLLELHRPAEAIAVLRPAIRGGVDGSNTYTSRTELHEALALAFEQAGQADSARAHWRAVESAWRRADPELRDRYQRAKLKASP
jgi:DNA-binding SARP family transcriptional activator